MLLFKKLVWLCLYCLIPSFFYHASFLFWGMISWLVTIPLSLYKWFNLLCVWVWAAQAGWDGGVSNRSLRLSLKLVKHAAGYIRHISQVNTQSNTHTHRMVPGECRGLESERQWIEGENFSPRVKINKHFFLPSLSFSLSNQQGVEC